MTDFPARLHVLLAREAPVGLVIRRGPSKCVATFLWQREQDEFSLGQWFKGRIYERRCDLSPDGRHLIYFAMNGQWDSAAKGSWTAISQAPYLKALTMLPKGDCWNGGGLWTGRQRYWLNDRYDSHTVLHDSDEFARDLSYHPETNWGGECPGVYYPRLLRDGWRLTAEEDDQTVFEKTLWDGWVLRKTAHAQSGAPPGKGCYWDEHQLVHRVTGQSTVHPAWEWADVDRCRLVWAEQGKLYAGAVRAGGLNESVELHDFNGMEYRPTKAPY